MSWAYSKVYVEMTTENIQNGPEWVDSISVTREYEHWLYDYYAGCLIGRPLQNHSITVQQRAMKKSVPANTCAELSSLEAKPP